jgi:small-conductance mechanosensitive channel
MSPEINLIWNEVLHDLPTPVAWRQLAIVGFGLFFAWSINGFLKQFIAENLDDSNKLARGSIKRVLFPISSLLFIWVAQSLIQNSHHVGVLQLANKLLLAMIAIRLIVYAIRSVFPLSTWIRPLENVMVWSIWFILALHLSGYLHDIIQALESVEVNFGKTPLNLYMLIQGVVTIFLTLLLAMWLSASVETRLMRQTQVSMNLRVVLVKIVRILFSLIAILVALSAVGLDITLLSVFGGALGVGLGFGLQKIASNYVSGFIILLDKSMKIGDLLTIDGNYGEVTDLRSRYTVLRKLDGTQVVIPNETLITSSVVNHSYTDKLMRLQMPVQVSYQTDLNLVIELLTTIIKTHPRPLKEPQPSVHIVSFGDNGIDLMLNLWIDDPQLGTMQLQTELYLALWNAFKEKGISIPYPQREVRILNENLGK